MTFQTYVKSPERIEVGPQFHGKESDIGVFGSLDWGSFNIELRNIRFFFQPGHACLEITYVRNAPGEPETFMLRQGQHLAFVNGHPVAHSLAGFEPEDPPPKRPPATSDKIVFRRKVPERVDTHDWSGIRGQEPYRERAKGHPLCGDKPSIRLPCPKCSRLDPVWIDLEFDELSSMAKRIGYRLVPTAEED